MKKLEKENIEDILTLTPMQEGMLFHYLKEPESDLYFVQLSLKISGEIDRELFKKAWNIVIETNEMLRAVFRWEKVDRPIQLLLKKYECQTGYYDFSRLDSHETKKRLEDLKTSDMSKNFDLREVPFRISLTRVGKGRYELVISNHHILYDGWSNGIILREFFNVYNTLSKRKELVKPVKTKFKEFIKYIHHQDSEKQEKFWKDYLTGIDTQTGLSIKRKRKGKDIKRRGTFRNYFTRDMKCKLERFVKKHKITLAALLYSAWGMLLQKYNNSEDVMFGTTVSGRSANIKGIETMVGLFINTLPLRVRIQAHSNEKIVNFLSNINRALQVRKDYESTSPVDIKRYSGISANEELFDTVLVIENYPLDHRLKQGNRHLFLLVDSYSIFERSHYDLTISVILADDVELNFSYRRESFDDASIERLSHHYFTIIGNLIEDREQVISSVEMIPPGEKRQVLFDFNETETVYPKDKTLYQLFEEQVENTPDNVAVVSADSVPKPNMQYISYSELNQKSNLLVGLLRDKGVGADSIVALMVDRSIEMIIGILAVLKSGGTYLPIDPEYPEERISYMMEDSGTGILVTTPEIQVKVKRSGQLQRLSLEFINVGTDLMSACKFSNLTSVLTSTCRVSCANLAYVIYTSGTTGNPNGVSVEHGNAVNVVISFGRRYRLQPGVHVILLSQYTFDASIDQIFGSLLHGAVLHVVDKGLLVDTGRLRKYIDKNQVHIINFVPALLDQLLSDGDRLPGVRAVISGGERLEKTLKDTLLSKGYTLFNHYGPTETTVHVLVSACTPGEVHLGKPIANIKCYILDKDRSIQPVGVPGELYISGVGVTRGYLNKPELTAEKFGHDFWDYQDCHDEKKEVEKTKETFKQKNNRKFLRGGPGGAVFSKSAPPGRRRQKIYKTGDLVRWLVDGNIEFLGRIDHQVKIRGVRIELGEIENQLLNHDDVKEAVVSVRDDKNGSKYLCAYIVPRLADSFETHQISAYLLEKLPDYMVPPYFVMLEAIPLTTAGKIDRKSLPEPGITTGKEYSGPRNEKEALMVQIWSEVLGIEKDKIGIDDNFFALGGHSLKATRLIGSIHKSLDIEIPLAELFKMPTVRGLSACIETAEEEKFVSIQAVEEKDFYVLSSAQKRLYILYLLDENSTGYNIPYAVKLEGAFEIHRLEEVFKKLIKRHESLRTSFHMIEGEPIRKIHDDMAFAIEYYEAYSLSLISRFTRPFDLSQPPLLRVALIKQEEEKHILMVDMHHIITDGASTGIFIREFMALYGGEKLLPIEIQYKDYSEWLNSKKKRETLTQQESYWLNEFKEEVPVVNLLLDYPRPAVQSFEGSTLEFEFGREEKEQLKALALEEESTLFMVLLSLFNILLSKISGQEDIVVGSPIAGRRHADLEQVIGMFVNTLALRNYPAGEKSFTEFLREVRERTLAALENQEYQFEDLVDKVVVKRDVSRNPLFDVMFVMQNTGVPEVEVPGLKLSPHRYETGISKFDLTFNCEEVEESMFVKVEYCTKLFEEETLVKFISYFKKIVSDVLNDNDRNIRIGEIEIISEEERRQLLYDFNDTEAAYPGDKMIHEIFEEQVGKTQDNIAVVGRGWHPRPIREGVGTRFIASDIADTVSITYRELKETSDQLAHLLLAKGVTLGTIVGIMAERSLGIIIGILAILKAGGAYLPIDPDYPDQRVAYMLADSAAKVLLSEVSKVSKEVEVIKLSKIIERNEDSPTHLTQITHPTQLCYVIYTSGTTGQPKGVLIEHKNLVRLMVNDKNPFNFDSHDVWTLFHSLCFDFSVWEMYGALLYGG
ncbi:MAG: amino acid adenylation domain-containing protein, partial [Candidatus Aminicenantes bacterium]